MSAPGAECTTLTRAIPTPARYPIRVNKAIGSGDCFVPVDDAPLIPTHAPQYVFVSLVDTCAINMNHCVWCGQPFRKGQKTVFQSQRCSLLPASQVYGDLTHLECARRRVEQQEEDNISVIGVAMPESMRNDASRIPTSIPPDESKRALESLREMRSRWIYSNIGCDGRQITPMAWAAQRPILPLMVRIGVHLLDPVCSGTPLPFNMQVTLKDDPSEPVPMIAARAQLFCGPDELPLTDFTQLFTFVVATRLNTKNVEDNNELAVAYADLIRAMEKTPSMGMMKLDMSVTVNDYGPRKVVGDYWLVTSADGSECLVVTRLCYERKHLQELHQRYVETRSGSSMGMSWSETDWRPIQTVINAAKVHYVETIFRRITDAIITKLHSHTKMEKQIFYYPRAYPVSSFSHPLKPNSKSNEVDRYLLYQSNTVSRDQGSLHQVGNDGVRHTMVVLPPYGNVTDLPMTYQTNVILPTSAKWLGDGKNSCLPVIYPIRYFIASFSPNRSAQDGPIINCKDPLYLSPDRVRGLKLTITDIDSWSNVRV